MTTRRALALGGAVLGMAMAAGVQAAGDPQAGRYKAQTCLGCHGIDSYANVYPSYKVPKLGASMPSTSSPRSRPTRPASARTPRCRPRRAP
ncbi:MAG: cytochrome c [Halofilum sp. (in: g-proteobacteria)]|nr:cytochrome c [Halofilum sp. (in: g-proteobacteria)]